MAYKEGDKVFVPLGDKVFVPFYLKSELGYWHTLTKEEADAKNHMSEVFGKWAKELEELTKENQDE